MIETAERDRNGVQLSCVAPPLLGRTVEQELMLRLAGTVSSRKLQAKRIEALARACDYKQLRARLDGHQLLPLLGRRLAEVIGPAVPQSFIELVEATADQVRRRNMVLETLAHKLIDDLEGAGIPAMLLKGTALARSIYGDLGLRPSSDIDLLVAPEDLHRAVAVVRGTGYERPRDPVRRDGLPQLHFNLVHPRELPNVEVHWRVHWCETRFASEMLASATRTDMGRRPLPEHELATLLLLYARDGFLGLRLGADIAGWWDTYGGKVAPSCLDSLLDRHPTLAPALVTAAGVSGALVGFPVSDVLTLTVPAGRRARIATRLVNWTGDGDIDQCAATVVLVDGLLTPRRALWSFLRRALLLGPDAIAHRLDRFASNAMTAHLMALKHAAKLIMRWGLALWRSRTRSSPLAIR